MKNRNQTQPDRLVVRSVVRKDSRKKLADSRHAYFKNTLKQLVDGRRILVGALVIHPPVHAPVLCGGERDASSARRAYFSLVAESAIKKHRVAIVKLAEPDYDEVDFPTRLCGNVEDAAFKPRPTRKKTRLSIA